MELGHERSEWGCDWHAIKLLPGEVCPVCRRLAGEWKQEEADRWWQAFTSVYGLASMMSVRGQPQPALRCRGERMTYTLQELEAIVATCKAAWEAHVKVEGEELARDYRAAEIALLQAAIVAIPELVARIKELDHGYNAKPSEGSAARVTELAQTAALKRAKLEKALADAGLGDASGLDALGLEAFTDDAGDVKIRQKKRAAP